VKSVGHAQIIIPNGERLGGKVIEVEGLKKGMGDKLLIEDLTFTSRRAPSSASSARTAPANRRCSA
jgi:ATPase subunit of ABC transporter with duplicated ATPase domains